MPSHLASPHTLRTVVCIHNKTHIDSKQGVPFECSNTGEINELKIDDFKIKGMLTDIVSQQHAKSLSDLYKGNPDQLVHSTGFKLTLISTYALFLSHFWLHV
jgi:hypothetical protein